MEIPSEHFDRFYNRLVGDEAAVATLRDRLVESVTLSAQAQIGEPYFWLQATAMAAIREVVRAEDTTPEAHFANHEAWLRDHRAWQSIEENGSIGNRLTVGVLQSIENIYKEYSSTPQQSDRVDENIRRALGYIFGMACSGKFVSVLNIEAARLGVDPNRTIIIPQLLLRSRFKGAQNFAFEPSLRTIEDETGQLDIYPRFKRRGKILDRQCPATEGRVSIGDRSKSGLWIFMRTIGDVAVTEVFPRQFEIEKNSEP